MKQVASLRQYHAAYAGGHLYVWNVIFGLAVGLGGRGLGVVRLEQASEKEGKRNNGWIIELFLNESEINKSIGMFAIGTNICYQ